VSTLIPQISLNKRIKDNVTGFEILDLETLVNKSSNENIHSLHRLRFYAIILNADHPFEHQIDFKTVSFPKKHCFALLPGVTHRFVPDQKHQGKLIVFTEDFAEQYLQVNALSEIKYNLSLRSTDHFYPASHKSLSLINLMEKELKETNDSLSAKIIGGYLTGFLLDLLRSSHEDIQHVKNRKSSKHYFNFKTHLFDNYHLSRDANYYAGELGLTYKHLNDIVKSHSGKTAKEFISDHVILEAKRLLSTSEMSIKEIGFSCGFDEATNFTKFFKSKTGISPKIFKGNHKG
jgi:AraC-like DNA-binding protein